MGSSRGMAMTSFTRTGFTCKTAGMIASFAATLAFALSSVAAQEMTHVKFALLTVPGIWDAGVFAAVNHGFFKDESLEVEFISPATPADGLKLLASGDVDFATSHS